jgi:hypothetical protein
VNPFVSVRQLQKLTEENTMKRSLFATFALALSLAAFAAPLPQAQLDRINAFISSSLGDIGQMATVEVVEAEVSDTTGLLTSSKVVADVMGLVKLSLGVKLEGELVTLAAALEGSVAELGLSSEDLLAMAEEVRNVVDAVNAQGDYKATLTEKVTAEGTDLEVTMVPARNDSTLAVKNVSIKSFIPNDGATKQLSLAVEGAFNAKADNVVKAQIALTNIIKALGNEQAPDEQDFATLAQIIAEILDGLEQI